MADTRARLSDTQLAGLARATFGLTGPPPDLPDAAELEDGQGVLVAVREAGRLVSREVPRWRSPADVREQLADRAGVPTWVGLPPEDPADLPDQLLVLLPLAGTRPDAAVISAAAAAWSAAATGRDLTVVPVPVSPTDPEVPWPDLAAAYGGRLLGSGAASLTPRTGGRAVVFSGLSGAGKSTIAGRLVELLLESGRTVTLLDGDEVRGHLSAGLGFSRADRDTNVQRIGWVAGQIAKHGGIAICAPIAPYEETRASMRRLVEGEAGPGSFVLVHVATPLAECEARDRKGLYARARRGEIAEFTGISDPYEVPVAAEVTIDTRTSGVDDSARLVLAHLLADPDPRVPEPAG